MPFSLGLPDELSRAGWKVKIRDKERLEPPHVTILLEERAWRLNLRTGELLEAGARWNEIDPRVRAEIEAAWPLLRNEWDARYPDNPVGEVE